jgi:hypothetical protein
MVPCRHCLPAQRAPGPEAIVAAAAALRLQRGRPAPFFEARFVFEARFGAALLTPNPSLYPGSAHCG